MTDRSSIKYISLALAGAGPAHDAGEKSIAAKRGAYPYFVPFRYMDARGSYDAGGFSPAMLSAVRPYLGDWLMFCSMMQAGHKEAGAMHQKDSVQVIADVAREDAAIVAMPDKDAAEVPVDEVVAIPVTGGEGAPEAVLPQESIEDVTKTEEIPDVAVLEAVVLIEEEQEVLPVIEIVFDVTEAEVVIIAEEATKEELPVANEEADTEAGEAMRNKEEDQLIMPVFSQDYFLHEGEKISEEIPEELDDLKKETESEADKALMVMMSFSEWLLHFKHSAERQQEETKDQKALKTMWQKEKLAAAMEEENEEIPQNVFEMAVNSISKEDGVVSETLANIYIKQGKYDHAIELYRKLSLRNPQKNAYFARKIEEALKNKQT